MHDQQALAVRHDLFADGGEHPLERRLVEMIEIDLHFSPFASCIVIPAKAEILIRQ